VNLIFLPPADAVTQEPVAKRIAKTTKRKRIETGMRQAQAPMEANAREMPDRPGWGTGGETRLDMKLTVRSGAFGGALFAVAG